MAHAENISIAMVDDAAVIRRILAGYLSRQGFSIHSQCDNGQDLLDTLKDSASLPDLCLMDNSMPVMNGPEATRLLKAHYPSIKVIGFTFMEDCDAATLAGWDADGFISKDAAPQVIKAALQDIFELPGAG